jgi:hypothetical protein
MTTRAVEGVRAVFFKCTQSRPKYEDVPIMRPLIRYVHPNTQSEQPKKSEVRRKLAEVNIYTIKCEKQNIYCYVVYVVLLFILFPWQQWYLQHSQDFFLVCVFLFFFFFISTLFFFAIFFSFFSFFCDLSSQEQKSLHGMWRQ